MNNTPTKSAAPAQSEIESLLQGAYFHDAWSIPAAEPSLNALGQFLRVAKMTPLWIERLMAIRNQVVSAFGLKNLGGLSQIDATKAESECVPGDRVGIFTLISRSANEVVLGDKDKHLDVVVSVHKKADEGTGIARAMMRAVGNQTMGVSPPNTGAESTWRCPIMQTEIPEVTTKVLQAFSGADVCGTRYVGTEAVRDGFAEI